MWECRGKGTRQTNLLFFPGGLGFFSSASEKLFKSDDFVRMFTFSLNPMQCFISESPNDVIIIDEDKYPGYHIIF